MTNKILGWTAAGVVITLGGLYYVKTAHTKPAPSATAEPAAAREIRQLRAEIQSLRRDTAVSLARNARTPGVCVARPHPGPARQTPAKRRLLHRFPQLQRPSSKKPRPPRSSTTTSTTSGRTRPGASSHDRRPARLTNTLPKGTTLKNVECRAKLCRIESVHDSVDAYASSRTPR